MKKGGTELADEEFVSRTGESCHYTHRPRVGFERYLFSSAILSYNPFSMKTEPETTPVAQVESYTFSKAKLPKVLGYPLKRSLLDAALRSASVCGTVWFVRYSGRRNGKTVLDAYFGPEQYDYAASGKVMITVWPVPASERLTTENLLLNQGLPSLCRWLAKSLSQGNVWRGSPHSLTFERVGETLRCTEE
jgi:hypothetical protein